MSDVIEYAGPPQPGFYKIRLNGKGPWCAAAVFLPCPMVLPEPGIDPSEWCLPLDRSRRWQALVDGRPWHPAKVHAYGRRITAQEHAYLSALSSFARWQSPLLPQADPEKPIDLNSLPPLF